MTLGDAMKPCGPVMDERAAARARAAMGDGLILSPATWACLDPIFAASPYLTALARRSPKRLESLLADEPDARLDDLLVRTAAISDQSFDHARSALRILKQELHLLTALADLGGVWNLDQVTDALTRFADAALQAALAVAARAEVKAGRLTRVADATNPVPGWFCIAMGKQGAFELNYSSDIDVSVFFDPDALGGNPLVNLVGMDLALDGVDVGDRGEVEVLAPDVGG